MNAHKSDQTQKTGVANNTSRLTGLKTENERADLYSVDPASIIQRAIANPESLIPPDIVHLQRTIGNTAVRQFLSGLNGSAPVPPVEERDNRASELMKEKSEGTVIPAEENQADQTMISPLQKKGPESRMSDWLQSGMEHLTRMDLAKIKGHYTSETGLPAARIVARHKSSFSPAVQLSDKAEELKLDPLDPGEVAEKVRESRQLPQNISDTTIRYYTRNYISGHPTARLDIAVSGIISIIRSSEAFDDETGYHVPKNTTTTKSVTNSSDSTAATYSFYNNDIGCLDFLQPAEKKYPEVPHPSGTWDLNICDKKDADKLAEVGGNLKRTSRGPHFKAANLLRDGTNSDRSPAPWTWHHHKDKGRMQLIDSAVHSAFPHKGGFAIWGER